MDAQEELAFLRSVAASQLQTIKTLTLGCEKYGLTETTPIVRHLAAQDDEIERLRAELAEAKRIDCRSCFWFGEISRSCLGPGGGKACGGPGIEYVSQPPVRVYEIDAAMAGGAK